MKKIVLRTGKWNRNFIFLVFLCVALHLLYGIDRLCVELIDPCVLRFV